MKNSHSISDGIVSMEVPCKFDGSTIVATFDESDLEAVSSYGSWKAYKKVSIYTDFREPGTGRMVKATLHKLLSGSTHVEFLNGNAFDYRRANMRHAEKGKRNRSIGAGRKGNSFYTVGGVAYFKTNSTPPIIFMVDEEDVSKIADLTWNVNNKHGYVQTKVGRRDALESILLHRYVLGIQDSSVYVDHINGIKTDCRRSNMRLCTNSENLHNSEAHRLGIVAGVTPSGWGWNAQISVKGKRLRRKFKTRAEAQQQYEEWRQEHNPSGLCPK